MSEAAGVPGRILLATDLSARCDRALDRALSLAVGWKAKLTIVHVMEEPEETTGAAQKEELDVHSIARQRIRIGLRADVGDAVEQASVRVEEGDPAEVIEKIALEEGIELIITGIASEDPFARRPVMLGRTVERLLRRSPTPVLIVRNRVQSAYEHILVATDFSDSSGHALQAALRMFPFQQLRLLHVIDSSMTGRVAVTTTDPAAYQEQYRAVVENEFDTFLKSIYLPEEDRQRLLPVIEYGQPAQVIRAYVRDRGADLVVMGTHGRGAMYEAFLGSTAKSILATLPCDALVIREPRARAPAADQL